MPRLYFTPGNIAAENMGDVVCPFIITLFISPNFFHDTSVGLWCLKKHIRLRDTSKEPIVNTFVVHPFLEPYLFEYFKMKILKKHQETS